MPQPGLVACLAVAICILASAIGCGIARFNLATAYEAAETASTASVDDTEQADLTADSLPTVHKTFDAFAQHHRTLPHRTRFLAASRWSHHAPSWPTIRHRLNLVDTGPDVPMLPTARTAGRGVDGYVPVSGPGVRTVVRMRSSD
jgi:hypothetical protein